MVSPMELGLELAWAARRLFGKLKDSVIITMPHETEVFTNPDGSDPTSNVVIWGGLRFAAYRAKQKDEEQ
jgi:hypothetical protein